MAFQSSAALPAAPERPTATPPAVSAFADGVLSLVIGVAMVAIPIMTHIANAAAGMLVAVLVAGWCAWRMPQVSIVAVVVGFLFQNLIVALVVDHVASDDEFDIIRGYNFILLAVTWLVVCGRFLLDWPRRARDLDPFVWVSLAVFTAIGVHFLLGFAAQGLPAVIYLRNIVTPLLLFHICLLVFAQAPVRLGTPLTLLAVAFAACGFLEFMARDEWMRVSNSYAYWERSNSPNYVTMALDKMAEKSGIISTGLLQGFRVTLFNSPFLGDLDIEVLRLFGPNMHAISFAYATAFFLVFCLYRGRLLLGLALLLLLVLTSVKGPLLVFLLASASFVVGRIFGLRFAFATHWLALSLYAAAGVYLGLSIGDYHIIGLMAGLQDFVYAPLGRGLGAGGNFSPDFVNIDWPAAQAAGRTPFAVESSVGVLIYQMGIFAFAVMATYVWVGWRVLEVARRTGNALHAATAFALTAVVVTGLFQEEAYFSPLALGMFMALSGMILGAAARTGLPTRS